MRLEDVMTKEVAFCGPQTNASAAAELMWTKNCGSLPIVSEEGRVVGIVTDRDLFIALGTGNRRPAELPVGEVMNKDVVECAPGDDVRSALKTMAKRQVHRVVVVDQDGALRGIVSMDDLVLGAQASGLSNQDVVTAMKAICTHRAHRAAA